MPITPAIDSWGLAEKVCFAYLKEKLEGFSGVTAYLPQDAPATPKLGQKDELWVFEINGPGSEPPVVINPSSRPFCSWRMGAMLRGMFGTRERAQKFSFLVYDVLPHKDSDQGIQYFNYLSMPTVQKQPVMLRHDENEGGEVDRWFSNVQLEVVFNNRVN